MRTVGKRDRHDFFHVRPISPMAAIDRTVRLKSSANAAMVIHYQIRVAPTAAKFQVRTMVGNELSGQHRPVVHVQINLFAIG